MKIIKTACLIIWLYSSILICFSQYYSKIGLNYAMKSLDAKNDNELNEYIEKSDYYSDKSKKMIFFASFTIINQ